MSASANQPQGSLSIDELKWRLKVTWMTGDYDLFSRYMQSGTEQFFERTGVKPGMRLLDVACGSGQVALIAARNGVQAVGCDIATNWLERARLRAAAEGLPVSFDEGDAESLPYRDAEFDAVVSSFGAMFAPRPECVSVELTRVCRPGGVIAMANWTPGGFIGQMFKVISRHIAPPGMPSPVLWGDQAVVRDRLRDGIARVECTPRLFPFDYPFPPEDVVEFFRQHYGPTTRAFAALDAQGQAELRSDLVSLWSKHNLGSAGETKVDAEYLEVVASRG